MPTQMHTIQQNSQQDKDAYQPKTQQSKRFKKRQTKTQYHGQSNNTSHAKTSIHATVPISKILTIIQPTDHKS